jgi:hypothetical protein
MREWERERAIAEARGDIFVIKDEFLENIYVWYGFA